MSILAILILIAMFATLAILVTGVVVMGKGGELDKKYANTLMRMRVISQFITLGLIALFALTHL